MNAELEAVVITKRANDLTFGLDEKENNGTAETDSRISKLLPITGDDVFEEMAPRLQIFLLLGMITDFILLVLAVTFEHHWLVLMIELAILSIGIWMILKRVVKTIGYR